MVLDSCFTILIDWFFLLLHTPLPMYSIKCLNNFIDVSLGF